MAHALRLLALIGIFGASSGARSEVLNVRLPSEGPRFMRVFGTAYPPHGFVKFCDRFASECAQSAPENNRLEMTVDRLRLLDEINRGVNRAIKPATDQNIYGVSEYWTLPTARGDCEDYALLKRHLLIREGWPASALLMTVVRDEKGEGHAVLTVRTASGDFIADNKNDQLKLWHQTPYEFVMRQSYINPRVWMSLDPSDGRAPGVMAGVDSAR